MWFLSLCSLYECLCVNAALPVTPQGFGFRAKAVVSPGRHRNRGKLSDLVAEHLDHLHYLNDILIINCEFLNDVLTDHLLNRLFLPLYVYSLENQDKVGLGAWPRRACGLHAVFRRGKNTVTLSRTELCQPPRLCAQERLLSKHSGFLFLSLYFLGGGQDKVERESGRECVEGEVGYKSE